MDPDSTSVDSRLADIINESQLYSFDKELGIEMCRDHLDKDSNDDAFVNRFCDCLEEFLILDASKYERVSRVREFIVEFLNEFAKSQLEISIRNQILDHLIQVKKEIYFRNYYVIFISSDICLYFKNHKANSDKVRHRICQLFNEFLRRFHEKSSYSVTSSAQFDGKLDEKLFNELQSCLLERIYDINIDVQFEAINGIAYLQTPTDRFCRVVNSFVYILRNNPSSTIRCIVLDNIAVNSLTFNLIRNELIYDADKQIRSKAVSILLKKVSNEHMDARLRKNVLDCLMRDNNTDLLERFVLKWLSTDDSALDFIASLDLSNVWFDGYEQALVSTAQFEAKLDLCMSYVYKQLNVLKVAKELATLNLNESLETAFYFRSFVYFCVNELEDESEKLRILNKLDQRIYSNTLKSLTNEPELNKRVCLTYNYIFDGCYHLNKELIHVESFVNVLLTLRAKQTQTSPLIFESLILKLNEVNEYVDLLKYVWNHFKRNDENTESIKKSLLTLICVLMKLKNREYNELSSLKSTDLESNLDIDFNVSNYTLDFTQSFVDFLWKNILLTSIKSQDPSIRALTIRALGLLSLLDLKIAEKSFDIFFKAINFDYPEVLIEAQKAFFNIFLCYAPILTGDNHDSLAKVTSLLEKQMNCMVNFNFFQIKAENH